MEISGKSFRIYLKIENGQRGRVFGVEQGGAEE
jgi:hypothetical protein